jgi:hypothetical protein
MKGFKNKPTMEILMSPCIIRALPLSNTMKASTVNSRIILNKNNKKTKNSVENIFNCSMITNNSSQMMPKNKPPSMKLTIISKSPKDPISKISKDQRLPP